MVLREQSQALCLPNLRLPFLVSSPSSPTLPINQQRTGHQSTEDRFGQWRCYRRDKTQEKQLGHKQGEAGVCSAQGWIHVNTCQNTWWRQYCSAATQSSGSSERPPWNPEQRPKKYQNEQERQRPIQPHWKCPETWFQVPHINAATPQEQHHQPQQLGGSQTASSSHARRTFNGLPGSLQ